MLHVKELSEGGWQTEGKSKVKGQFDGAGKKQRLLECKDQRQGQRRREGQNRIR